MIYSNGKKIAMYSVITHELPLSSVGLEIDQDNLFVNRDFSQDGGYVAINQPNEVHINNNCTINVNCNSATINHLNGQITAENLAPENIVEGVEILGVHGTYKASGGSSDTLTEVINGTIIEFNNAEITRIPRYLFYQNKGLINVNTPNVEKIEDSAFNYCENLTNATFGDNVSSIGQSAFNNCKKLENLNLEGNYTSIGSNAFYGCQSLTSIILPKSLKTLGNYSFRECTNLDKIYYKGTMEEWFSISINESYGNPTNYAKHFYIPNDNGEWEEIKEITIIPNSSNSFNQYILQNSKCFTKCIIPNTIISFPYACFSGSNFEIFEFEENSQLTDISTNIFSGCHNLKNIELPIGVSKIGSSVFNNCTNLEKVIIPGATSIDYYAFKYCWIIKSIKITQSETICTLGSNAFGDLLFITGGNTNNLNPNRLKTAYIYVPASRLAEYKVATNWVKYETQIAGHQDFNVGDTLPNYANENYTTCTWYSDEAMTNEVQSVETNGTYYCKLGA